MVRVRGSEGEEDTAKLSTRWCEVQGDVKPKDFENFSHGGKGGLTRTRWYSEKARKQAKAWKKLMIPNTPDCGAIMNPHHFRPNILIQHPVSSHTMYACAHLASAAGTYFCSSNLPNPSHPTSGPLHVLLYPPRMPPFPHAIFTWLVYL